MVWKPDKSRVKVYHADKTARSEPPMETHSRVSKYKTRKTKPIKSWGGGQAVSLFAIYFKENRTLYIHKNDHY